MVRSTSKPNQGELGTNRAIANNTRVRDILVLGPYALNSLPSPNAKQKQVLGQAVERT